MLSSEFQTKDWRKSQDWYEGGRKTECEKYQLSLLKTITHRKNFSKTQVRINDRILIIVNKPKIEKDETYDWTENVDYFQKVDDKFLYYNLKFVCMAGGGQTSRLKDVNRFVEAQFKILKKKEFKRSYFINIFDGDECFKNISKFKRFYKMYPNLEKFVYIGDSFGYEEWFNKNIN